MQEYNKKMAEDYRQKYLSLQRENQLLKHNHDTEAQQARQHFQTELAKASEQFDL